MEVLLALEGNALSDSGTASDGSDHIVTLEISVATDDPRVALGEAFTAFRTAVHAMGAETTDWPSGDDVDDMSAALVYHAGKVSLDPVG